jgi:hypothetical protein
VDEDDLIALTVAEEAQLLVARPADGDLHVIVEHE